MQEFTMNKIMMVMLVTGAVLIATSMASLVAAPAQPASTRKIVAGNATLLVPLNLPREIMSGTKVSGSVLLASKEDCDITYDRFTGIYWSDRDIAGTALLPSPAYTNVSEQTGTTLDLGNGEKATTRTIELSAEKPCGKTDVDTLNVIDLYCSSSKTHYAIVGIQDPFMTQQKVVEIAKSLKCS
jgi:hypothetical protein